MMIFSEDIQCKFYPLEKEKLHKIFNNLKFKGNMRSKRVRAFILPHASYLLTGDLLFDLLYPIKEYKNNNITIIIIGLSHYYCLNDHYLMSNKKKIHTPLGKIGINKSINDKLKQSKKFKKNSRYFIGEHSIFSILPFIQMFIGNNFKIVPLILGNDDWEKVSYIVNNIMKDNSQVLLIGSSDLHHGYSEKETIIRDNNLISKVKKNKKINVDSITYNEIRPLLCVYQIFKNNDWKIGDSRYKTSAVMGKKHVVGYYGVNFYENN